MKIVRKIANFIIKICQEQIDNYDQPKVSSDGKSVGVDRKVIDRLIEEDKKLMKTLQKMEKENE